MSAAGRWRRRLWYFLNRRRVERDLEREMAGHRAMLDDPRRFGSALRLRERNADVWGWTWIDDLIQDLRYAFRLLRRSPAFALAAVTTLALGIGGSTAIFSVAYGVSLRPLPYRDPDRLVRLFEANPRDGQMREAVSEGQFADWRQGAPSLESAALYTHLHSRYPVGSTQPVTMLSVSPVFFDLLGVSPILGRSFKNEQEYGRSTDEVVLSHAAWQRLFGGRPDAIGASVTVRGAGDDDVYVVVGVMPREFRFDQPVDMWRTAIMPPSVPRIVRTWRYDNVIARLRPGATIEQARAELEAVAARLAREFPASNGGWTVTIEPLQHSVVGDFGRFTWLMLAAVAVALLVTCVNVAGLLLTRAVARDREAAVREALGAARWRLVRLRLAESLLLASIGAGCGLLLAWLGVSALKAAAPPGIPRLDEIVIDGPVLAVAIAAALAAMVIITAAPLGAGRAARHQLVGRLHAGSPAAGDAPHRQRARQALVIAQCAGAVILVVVAIMLTRSLVRLASVDLGWNAAGVVSLRADPPLSAAPRIPWYWLLGWSDRLIARLEATPGIEGAAITTSVPLSPYVFPVALGRGRGKFAADNERWAGVLHRVTDRYFDLMGVSLIEGRTFLESDRFGEAQFNPQLRGQRRVAVVSQSLARTFWPGRPALGEALWIADLGNDTGWYDVVGVVEDIQFHGVGTEPALHLFVPWTQGTSGAPLLLVKGRDDAASLTALVRRVVQEVHPGTGVDQVTALDDLVSRATAQPRFTARTVAAFGLLALVLTAVGIYGTLSFVVGSRTREIAVRLSLGATARDILHTMLAGGLTPVLAGGLIGVVLAGALAKAFETLLFQIEPLDGVSFMAGAALLLLATLVAALAPALRVLRVNPSTALRAE